MSEGRFFSSIIKDRYGINCIAIIGAKKPIETKEKYCNGFLHFQISCNSTDETKRKELFGGADVLSLEEIIKIINKQKISNRTVTLNFIVMKNVPIDIDYLIKLGLNPQKFAVKLIPLNHTLNAESNSLETKVKKLIIRFLCSFK